MEQRRPKRIKRGLQEEEEIVQPVYYAAKKEDMDFEAQVESTVKCDEDSIASKEDDTFAENVDDDQTRKENPRIKLKQSPSRSAQVLPGSASDCARDHPATPTKAETDTKRKTNSEEASSSRKKKAKADGTARNKTVANTMFSCQQLQEAAPISAKQKYGEDQKQEVQRNFSTDHGFFKKFWELVSCRKYQGKGYGEEIEAYMPPSQTFLEDEQEYNRWKELATSQGCTPKIVAQRAEYKKKLFEAFPAKFYWAKIDFSKMTKNILEQPRKNHCHILKPDKKKRNNKKKQRNNKKRNNRTPVKQWHLESSLNHRQHRILTL
jgi:hypothetical protein